MHLHMSCHETRELPWYIWVVITHMWLSALSCHHAHGFPSLIQRIPPPRGGFFRGCKAERKRPGPLLHCTHCTHVKLLHCTHVKRFSHANHSTPSVLLIWPTLPGVASALPPKAATLIVEPSPPSGWFHCRAFSISWTKSKRNPPEKQPQFLEKDGVVFQGGSSCFRFMDWRNPTKKPPGGRGVLALKRIQHVGGFSTLVQPFCWTCTTTHN